MSGEAIARVPLTDWLGCRRFAVPHGVDRRPHRRQGGAYRDHGRRHQHVTAAVLKLGRTNQLAASILDSAKPLEGQLTEILGLARAIDGVAGSINGTAVAINGTAKGINASAATILGTARSIKDGVAQINANLDTTIDVARAIKSDTGNILGQADVANHYAACIDRGLLSSTASTTC